MMTSVMGYIPLSASLSVCPFDALLVICPSNGRDGCPFDAMLIWWDAPMMGCPFLGLGIRMLFSISFVVRVRG